MQFEIKCCPEPPQPIPTAWPFNEFKMRQKVKMKLLVLARLRLEGVSSIEA